MPTLHNDDVPILVLLFAFGILAVYDLWAFLTNNHSISFAVRAIFNANVVVKMIAWIVVSILIYDLFFHGEK